MPGALNRGGLRDAAAAGYQRDRWSLGRVQESAAGRTPQAVAADFDEPLCRRLKAKFGDLGAQGHVVDPVYERLPKTGVAHAVPLVVDFVLGPPRVFASRSDLMVSFRLTPLYPNRR